MIASDINGMFDSLLQSGCSPFFFTQAAQSAIFGEIARSNQVGLAEENLEFRERMQQLRDDFSREKLDTQILFRRESYELGKQYLIQQAILQEESRRKMVQFEDFCKLYWPLNSDVYTVLKSRHEILQKSSIVPLKVLVPQTEVSSYDIKHPIDSYGEFCDRITYDFKQISGLDIQMRPWKEKSKSFICESMNLHYLMNGMPTLLVFPYQQGENFSVEVFGWTFAQGGKSMMHYKPLKISGFDAKSSLEQAISATKAVIGMTRDAYIMTEYRLPAAYIQNIDEQTLQLPEVRNMLGTHYRDLFKRIEQSDDYQILCTKHEITEIIGSITNGIKRLAQWG